MQNITVRELLSVLDCTNVQICFGGFANEIDKNDQLQMNAYGDYIVDRATFTGEGEAVLCEITLKCGFLKRGA